MTPLPLCGTCPHLLTVNRSDFYPERPQYFCEALDGKVIGFVAVRPEWCPILEETNQGESDG